MNTILLFGMPGGGELFFIVLIVIMLFGSKKIPELARGLGKGMREIKNATGDIQREIREGARDINNIKDKVDVEKQVKDLIKGEKEKREESLAKNSSPIETTTEESTTDNQQSETSKPISQTVKRKSPYAKEDTQNPTENG